MNTAEIQTASQFDVSKAIDHGGLTHLQRWTYVLAFLAMITSGGSDAYLNLLGGSMIVSMLGLAMLRSHIGHKH